jgi:hypothetical protein
LGRKVWNLDTITKRVDPEFMLHRYFIRYENGEEVLSNYKWVPLYNKTYVYGNKRPYEFTYHEDPEGLLMPILSENIGEVYSDRRGTKNEPYFGPLYTVKGGVEIGVDILKMEGRSYWPFTYDLDYYYKKDVGLIYSCKMSRENRADSLNYSRLIDYEINWP